MTDEELIQRWKDARSTPDLRKSDLRELLDRHLDQVRWLVLCSVGSNNGRAAQTDDLVQEIMLKAVKNLDRFEGRSSFSTWLYRIAINTTRTFCSSKRLYEEPFSDDVFLAERVPRPDQLAERNELDAAIQTAIQKLPDALRNAISLTVLDGLAPQDVAEIEQCTVSSVYRRLHDARKILKEQLKKFM